MLRSKIDRNEPMTISELGLLDLFGFKDVGQCKIYHCTRVKLRFSRVYIESLTMSSKIRRKRNPKEILHYFVSNENAQCYYAPARKTQDL